MPNRPRWFKEHSAYSAVQRTADRQFLFKPEQTTRTIIGGAAARAQAKFPVKFPRFATQTRISGKTN